MDTLEGRILDVLHRRGPMTDAELAEELPERYLSAVNSACHRLQDMGKIKRVKEMGQRIKNIPLTTRGPIIEPRAPSFTRSSHLQAEPPSEPEALISEDEIKLAVRDHLASLGYEVTVGWSRGVDIEATQPWDRIMIVAKGEVASEQQQDSDFLQAIGQLVQRLADPEARYGLALPWSRRYRRLVQNLPDLARERLRLVEYWVYRAEFGLGVIETGYGRDNAPDKPEIVLVHGVPADREYLERLQQLRERMGLDVKDSAAPSEPEQTSMTPNLLSTHPPAWYPDPQDPKLLRWWDGSQWTRHTHLRQ